MWKVGEACRPAQFVEETKKGDTVAPRAIVLSVLATAVFGFAYVLSLLFCIQVCPVQLSFIHLPL